MRSTPGNAALIWLLFCSALAAQWWPPPPHPTALPSRPFFIRNIWYIGGVGPWDLMTVDPSAGRLYIAHGPVVQVVDVQSGALAGEIRGLSGARAIALDDKGAYGYISDGPAGRVVVFDRNSLQTVASIVIGPDPRSLVYEPRSGLVFAVQPAPAGPSASSQQARRTRPQPQSAPKSKPESYITIVDPQSDSVLGRILVSGHLGYAQADEAGQVYVASTDAHAIFHFNAGALAAELHDRETESTTAPNAPASATHAKATNAPPILDWTGGTAGQILSGAIYGKLPLGQECGAPRGFAVDGHDFRLFAACSNMTLKVLNTANSRQVAVLPIGSGVDEIGYDPVHDYLFAADGARDGNLTVIQRNSATDTYAIVQNLPTRQRAYVMAVDPENGEVYMVTDIVGVDLARPGGIGALRTKPVEGSFQVIEIGN